MGWLDEFVGLIGCPRVADGLRLLYPPASQLGNHQKTESFTFATYKTQTIFGAVPNIM